MASPYNLDHISIIGQYRDGIGVMELSRQYSVHRSTIQRLLIKYDVEFHSRVPVNSYNYTFFKSYTPESCYWAGFIMADGHIRSGSHENALSIKLSIQDYDHLVKFKRIIGYIGNIYKNKDDTYCYINLSGELLIKTLRNNFNITTRKSLTAEFPKLIPVDMITHFIRGYFDGDGTVCIVKHRLVCGFIGTYDMLTNIQDYFLCNGIRARTETGKIKLFHRSLKNTYAFSHNSRNTKDMLKLMYENSTELCRLDRKYKFFVSSLTKTK